MFCAGMYVSLKSGFQSLATLNLLVNVVGELPTENNSCSIARFPCNSTVFLFSFMWTVAAVMYPVVIGVISSYSFRTRVINQRLIVG